MHERQQQVITSIYASARGCNGQGFMHAYAAIPVYRLLTGGRISAEGRGPLPFDALGRRWRSQSSKCPVRCLAYQLTVSLGCGHGLPVRHEWTSVLNIQSRIGDGLERIIVAHLKSDTWFRHTGRVSRCTVGGESTQKGVLISESTAQEEEGSLLAIGSKMRAQRDINGPEANKVQRRLDSSLQGVIS